MKEIISKATKREIYTLSAIMILVLVGAGIFIVNALTPGVAPNPGHLISETAPPSPCSANQVLKFDGSNWFCASDNVGITSESDPTVNSYIKNKGSCAAITGSASLCDGNDANTDTHGYLSCWYQNAYGAGVQNVAIYYVLRMVLLVCMLLVGMWSVIGFGPV